MINKKIKTQKEIIEIVEKLKKQDKKIVAYNGSFDVLHLGHIRALEEASQQGDVLIVLLNSDKSVKSYKGPTRPIVPEAEREETLSAIENVDYVVIFDEINPKKILDGIKPNVYVSGSDWGKNCIEREVIEKNGGTVYVLGWVDGLSTSGLIERILKVNSTPVVKAVLIDRDGTININDPEYTHRIEDFKFTEKAIPALQWLSKTDYKIIIHTNQSGIARGYYAEDDMQKLHKWMLGVFKEKNIRIDKIYHCPHHPDFTGKCECRKPKPGMLFKAVKDFDISLAKSWVIGDGKCDIIVGREVNAKTIKIGKKMPEELKLEPNFYAKNLWEAVDIIKKDS